MTRRKMQRMTRHPSAGCDRFARSVVARGRRDTLAAVLVIGPTLFPTGALSGPAADTPAVEESASDSFMPMAPFNVTVVGGRGPRGVLAVAVGLEIPDSDLRARVRAGMPRLRDHMLRSLTQYAGSAVTFTRPVDAGRIAGRLQAVADAYAQGGTIRVLLVNLTLQRR